MRNERAATSRAGRRTDQIALLGSLAWRYPPLRDALDEHLADNNGEILPHLLMADYQRWAAAGRQLGEPTVSAFLSDLEEAYVTGGDEIENLISVSFLEHIPRPGEPGAEIRNEVGPALAAQLEVIG